MNWHRLFGLVLTDFFTGSPFEVELEKDLSIKQQLLDVVVIRKRPGSFDGRLPDGLDDLADHNLISFKSHHEAFDAWTVNELIGHYVNYRKQVNAPNETPPPENDFRLYGVCARHPLQLAGQIELNRRSPGVYDCELGVVRIRLIVLRDLPDEEHNSPLHLFSAERDKVQYGQSHYQHHSPDISTLVHQLLGRYTEEGTIMPYTMEDFKREVREEALKDISVEEVLRIAPSLREEALNDVSIEEIVERFPIDKLLKQILAKKRLQGVSTEELLSHLSADEIETYLQKIKGTS